MPICASHAVEHVQNPVAAADRLVAHHQAAQIHGQKTTAMQGVGEREHHQAAGDDQNRVKAGGQVDTVDQLQKYPASAQAHHCADTELLQQMADQAEMQAALVAHQHVDQRDGEEHCHRVVAARFDFQGGCHPLVQALAAQQRKDRGGVGGTDNRTDQQALQHVQVEQPGRHHAGEPGGDQDAYRGQRQRRPQGHPKACHPGTQPAIEQDHGQGQVADQIGGGIVVEDDAAAIDPCCHTDGQDNDQYGNAQARRQRADQNARTYQQRADQEEAVDGCRFQWRYS
jgi:hypothetical protein